MRFNLLLLILTFSSFSLFSQTESLPLTECCGVESTQDTCITFSYTNSNNVRTMLVQASGENVTQQSFSYNQSGNVTQETNEEWNGTSWQIVTEITNTYTSSQNLNLQTVVVGDGMGGEVNSTRVDFDYNNSGNITKEARDVWDGSAWSPVSDVVTSYTSSQLPNIQTTRLSDGMGGLVNSTRVDFDYNNSGNITKESRDTWDGTSWNAELEITNTYTGAQNLNISTTRVGDGMGGLVNSTRLDYNYNSSGNIIFIGTEIWNNDQWEPASEISTTFTGNQQINMQIVAITDGMGGIVNSTRVDFDYNSSGNITKEARDIWDGSAWSPISETITSYTSSQNPNIVTTSLSDGMGGLVNSSRVDFDYNSSGNITKEARDTWDGSSWIPTLEITNTYTSAQNLNVSITQVSDGMGGLVNSTMSDFNYNQNGDITSEDYSMWVDGEWVVDQQCSKSWKVVDIMSAVEENLLANLNCIIENPILNTADLSCTFDNNINDAVFVLYDAMGTVFDRQVIRSGGSLEIGNELRAGIYFATIHTKGKIMYNKKLIVFK